MEMCLLFCQGGVRFGGDRNRYRTDERGRELERLGASSGVRLLPTPLFRQKLNLVPGTKSIGNQPLV